MGEPVLAYFLFLCSAPLLAAAGLVSGRSFTNVVATLGTIAISALFAAVLGVWISSLFESRSRGVGLIATIGIYLVGVLAYEFWGISPYALLAALSPVRGLKELTGEVSRQSGLDFGVHVPWALLTALMYVIVGAWLTVMLVRNIRKDLDDLYLLSRWQSVLLIATANLMLWATFNTRWATLTPLGIAMSFTIFNGPLLFATALTTLSPLERLKAWWRNITNKTLFMNEDGLPWPWILLSSAVAYLFICLALLTWQTTIGYEPKTLLIAGLEMLAIAVFVSRDVLFVQWCRLTRLRAPTSKGLMFLVLYYVFSLVVCLIASLRSERIADFSFGLLTPFSILAIEHQNRTVVLAGISAGIGVQIVASL
ncbi:MAG TPA: hypothetical protein VFM05_08350, partial [Candidatus Saccharimonadales bacterium]|nr:hypothetical protein [Candidatus Saccharimonadales bacterium]